MRSYTVLCAPKGLTSSTISILGSIVPKRYFSARNFGIYTPKAVAWLPAAALRKKNRTSKNTWMTIERGCDASFGLFPKSFEETENIPIGNHDIKGKFPPSRKYEISSLGLVSYEEIPEGRENGRQKYDLVARASPKGRCCEERSYEYGKRHWTTAEWASWRGWSFVRAQCNFQVQRQEQIGNTRPGLFRVLERFERQNVSQSVRPVPFE